MFYMEQSGYCFVSNNDSKETNQEGIALIQKKDNGGSKLGPCSQADVRYSAPGHTLKVDSVVLPDFGVMRKAEGPKMTLRFLF